MGDDGSNKREGAAANMELVITAHTEQFINLLGQFFAKRGISPIGGRIWGLLLVSPQPLTAEQIANTLRVSRGSVSTNIRIFVQTRVVEKLLLTGDRRGYYRIPVDGLYPAMQQRTSSTSELVEIAKQGLNVVPVDSPARANMEDLAEFVHFAAEYLSKLHDAWQAHRSQLAERKTTDADSNSTHAQRD